MEAMGEVSATEFLSGVSMNPVAVNDEFFDRDETTYYSNDGKLPRKHMFTEGCHDRVAVETLLKMLIDDGIQHHKEQIGRATCFDPHLHRLRQISYGKLIFTRTLAVDVTWEDAEASLARQMTSTTVDFESIITPENIGIITWSFRKARAHQKNIDGFLEQLGGDSFAHSQARRVFYVCCSLALRWMLLPSCIQRSGVALLTILPIVSPRCTDPLLTMP
jgi:hypothetical protein